MRLPSLLPPPYPLAAKLPPRLTLHGLYCDTLPAVPAEHSVTVIQHLNRPAELNGAPPPADDDSLAEVIFHGSLAATFVARGGRWVDPIVLLTAERFLHESAPHDDTFNRVTVRG